VSSAEHICKIYILSNILWFFNVLQNGEMCIHGAEYLKTKEKSCIMAIKGKHPAYVIVLSSACPYICALCSNTLTDIRYLEAYQTTHSGECPCHCEVCNEVSSVQIQLNTSLPS
jgi:hypothetical protein